MSHLSGVAPSTMTIQPIVLCEDGVRLLDQTRLPHTVEYVMIHTVPAMVDAIKTMIVRGAPAIGIAGAYGLVLSARNHQHLDQVTFVETLLQDATLLEAARPTAVNLQWAIARLRALIHSQAAQSPAELRSALEADAVSIYEEDLAMCHAIGRHGASLVPKGARILTHCNAGALATAGYGTALGVIRSAFEQDPGIQVYADETRPRLQGARLTTWEMVQEGIPVTLISDNMSAWLMKQGKVDLVVVGADRIAQNGDSANKIGTYLLALAAKAHQIPFYVAAPSSTIDYDLPTGEDIPIEERSTDEIYQIDEAVICPQQGVQFYNPGFDVTPGNLITAIITEQGIQRPPYRFVR